MRDKENQYEMNQSRSFEVREAVVKYEAGRIYTYDEVQEMFTETQKWEMMDGVPYAMAAASPRHQELKIELAALFRNYLKGKSCRVFSEIEIRLDTDKNDTFLIPDLFILCDKSKRGPKGVIGAPDMIVEILSPSNARHDRLTKRRKYQQVGVKEYWLLDPRDDILEVALLGEDGLYRSITYGANDVVKVNVLEDLEIDLADLFANAWWD